MAGSKVVTGARAKVIIGGKVVGVFTNFSFTVNYDAQPIYVMGNEAPVEIVYTGAEPVHCAAGGWRIIGKSPIGMPVDGSTELVPKLENIMKQPTLEISVFDRQTNQSIGKISGAKSVSFTTGWQSRQPADFQVSFIGLTYSDEGTSGGDDTDHDYRNGNYSQVTFDN
jgi:hypothetical protein